MNNDLIKELETSLKVETKNLSSSGYKAIMTMYNDSPSSYEVYIYGACEFIYSDGTTYQDNQLARVYRGSSIIWTSNSDEKCVVRVNIAVIAKSDKYLGQGNYAYADSVPDGQCAIEGNWTFGLNSIVKKESNNLEDFFNISKVK